MAQRGKVDCSLKDIYTYYRNTRSNTLNYEAFSKIVKLLHHKLLEHAFNGDYITLPERLGDIYIKKYKPKYTFRDDGQVDTFKRTGLIDYKATKEFWKQYPELEHKQWLLYDNSHTDGFKFKIHWRRGPIRNINLYNFRPARIFKRGLAEFTRNNPNKDYYDS